MFIEKKNVENQSGIICSYLGVERFKSLIERRKTNRKGNQSSDDDIDLKVETKEKRDFFVLKLIDYLSEMKSVDND